jgi:ornithine cyclodeaminase/alanine dehydrogenase-like protein (mu-crystallin family)
VLILSNEDIEKILPVGACLDVLEEAYRDLGNGMAATVPRYDVFSPTKPDEFYEYKTMSGVLPKRNIAALRLNSSVVKWYEKAGGVRKDKLPVAGGDKFVGLVMLFSTETGEPLAIFPDGYVQKLRVAGASAIAGAVSRAQRFPSDGVAGRRMAGERPLGDFVDGARFEAS